MNRLLSLSLLVASLACAGAPAPTLESAAALPAYVPGVVPDSFIVRLNTSRGEVDVLLRREWAPRGVAQVYEAVSTGYYDGARFFRTLRGFVTQFGIAADTALTARWSNRRIADDSVTQSNRRGTLVFASGGPNTRTVQLFINLRDNARLDAMGFAPLGEVVRGMDAVDAFYTGYVSPAPDQGRITREGEAYLAAEFPLLDRIVSAKVVRAWGQNPVVAP